MPIVIFTRQLEKQNCTNTVVLKLKNRETTVRFYGTTNGGKDVFKVNFMTVLNRLKELSSQSEELNENNCPH